LPCLGKRRGFGMLQQITNKPKPELAKELIEKKPGRSKGREKKRCKLKKTFRHVSTEKRHHAGRNKRGE